MKKILIIGATLTFFISCGTNNSSSTNEVKKDSANASTTSGPAADPEAKKGLALIAKSDCLTCHKLNEAATGPAYAAVAAKYRDHPETFDTLANKIIKGGSGNWGTIPMTSHPTISKEDALTMVHYVMSIK